MEFYFLLFSSIIFVIKAIAFELIELINSMLIFWISEFIALKKSSSSNSSSLFKKHKPLSNKNFALNVDYTLGLTKPKYKVEGDAETQLNNYFSSSAYENVSELKVGGEYRMNAFRLRGGYGIEKNPFSAQSLQSFNSSGGSVNTTLNNPFLGKRETLAGGIGYDFKSFYIDAGVQNVKSTYDNPFFGGKYAVTANNAFSVTDGDGVDNATSIVSEVKNTKTNFFLTLGWKF